MRRLSAQCLLGALVLLWTASAHAISDWSFTLLPPDGAISGPPGSTIGWGYSITNPDPFDWLVLAGISADPFLHASPNSGVFDFPIVGPSTGASVAYLPSVAGLYELTWDATAPVGFINSGTFVLTADWYDGDPFAGGTFLETGERRASYSATVAAAAVPEPSALLLLAVGMVALGIFRRATWLRR